jgi:hypothetical protein
MNEQFNGEKNKHSVTYYLVMYAALLIASNILLLGRTLSMVRWYCVPIPM